MLDNRYFNDNFVAGLLMDIYSNVSYVLKPNKSSRFDSISNEMIKCLIDIQPGLILKLFNAVFDMNVKIVHWAVAMITPIFKSGSKMNPTNYRGISIQSCLGKLFTAILNQRLLKHALVKQILKDEQLGFLAGNRTSDAHLMLHTLIQSYCHTTGKKIFSWFVDFKKAFDTIPRDILFQKLLRYGITGKFFNTLKTLYANDNCCVKVGMNITDIFQANQGVKQGFSFLSYLIIFLSDMVDRFNVGKCKPLEIGNSGKLECLLWADDLVLLSTSEDGLESMLSELSSEWRSTPEKQGV